MSQMVMSNCLSRRQVENKILLSFHHSRDLPLQVACGLTIHNIAQSQTLIKLLHNVVGCSIQVLKSTETDIARSVINKIVRNDSVYIPPDLLSV